MRVIERQEIKLQLKDLDAQQQVWKIKPIPTYEPRSTGIHVTGLLKYIAMQPGMETLIKNGQLSMEDFEQDFPVRMAVGMAWELWAQALWPEMVWQPGECELDGIAGSPDGYTADVDVKFGSVEVGRYTVLEEFKYTWKSRRNRHNSIVGEWLWIRQMMSYCKMMGLRFARLHVLWSNGEWDWKKEGGFSPVYNTYLIEFSDQDLDRHWVMMTTNKQRMLEDGGNS